MKLKTIKTNQTDNAERQAEGKKQRRRKTCTVEQQQNGALQFFPLPVDIECNKNRTKCTYTHTHTMKNWRHTECRAAQQNNKQEQ